MYPNTMRTTVRHGAKDSLRAILPLVGAVLTTRNERPCQVTFIEDGTSLLSPFDASLQAEGWSSLGEVFEQMAELQIDIFACRECAAFRAVPESDGPDRVQWLPASDLRFPLHLCHGPSKRLQLVTVDIQARGQSEFDSRVGKPTLGAA